MKKNFLFVVFAVVVSLLSVGCQSLSKIPQPLKVTIQDIGERPVVEGCWDIDNSSGIESLEGDRVMKIIIKYSDGKIGGGRFSKSGLRLKAGATYRIAVTATTANLPVNLSAKFHEPRSNSGTNQEPEYSEFRFPIRGTTTRSCKFIAQKGGSSQLTLCYGHNLPGAEFTISNIDIVEQRE